MTTLSNKIDLEKIVENFLKVNGSLKKPLLLGFSGGEDSLALAHCLLQLKIPFHLAHFNHGWREKSDEQCLQLKAWASTYEIPFHSEKSLKREKKENVAREERFQFFSTLFETKKFEALVLAHHKNDQVETILKRVLEGARLIQLKGIERITYRKNMPIWRPLLGVSKKEILRYLHQHQLIALQDETNFDPKYLRARMRMALLPNLLKEFGKEIVNPLVSIGNQAKLLKEYLDLQTKKYCPTVGPFGKMWDFSIAHPIEIEYILSQNFSLSRPIFERILNAIRSNRANHKIFCKSFFLLVDRKKLFWIDKPLPIFNKKVPLGPGIVKDEKWEWVFDIVKKKVLKGQNWLSWWQGEISFPLPEGEFELAPPSPFFRKAWNSKKVPAFLRDSLPIIVQREKPIAEFLSGIRSNHLNPLLKIKDKRIDASGNQKKDATFSLQIAINPRR